MSCSVSSTKTPGAKRATLLRASDYTKSFAKDWVRLTHSGRFNMKLLKEVMLLLIANDGPPCRRSGETMNLSANGRTIGSATSGEIFC